MELPTFRYHPDPLATGMVVQRHGVCACCQRTVEFLYIGPVYSQYKLREQVCPWCIADGSLCSRFDAMLADSYPLLKAGVEPSIVEEVTTRTPGFITWQQDEWIAHCGDACAFLGDATKETLRNLTPEQRVAIFHQKQVEDSEWKVFLSNYKQGGDPAIYHFRCLHCELDLFYHDCS